MRPGRTDPPATDSLGVLVDKVAREGDVEEKDVEGGEELEPGGKACDHIQPEGKEYPLFFSRWAYPDPLMVGNPDRLSE